MASFTSSPGGGELELADGFFVIPISSSLAGSTTSATYGFDSFYGFDGFLNLRRGKVNTDSVVRGG